MDQEHDVSRRDFLQRASLLGLAGFGASSVVTACGGGSGDGESSSSGGTSQSSSNEGSGSETVTIHPKGNQMKFKETEFTVPADTEVKLIFENTATSPSMQHNVLVLNESPGDGIFKEVGQAGVQAGASEDYVPPITRRSWWPRALPSPARRSPRPSPSRPSRATTATCAPTRATGPRCRARCTSSKDAGFAGTSFAAWSGLITASGPTSRASRPEPTVPAEQRCPRNMR